MYICVSCKQEMKCSQNGVAVHYGGGHVYPGDEFKCETCGNKIVATAGKSVFAPDINEWQNVVEMEHVS